MVSLLSGHHLDVCSAIICSSLPPYHSPHLYLALCNLMAYAHADQYLAAWAVLLMGRQTLYNV